MASPWLDGTPELQEYIIYMIKFKIIVWLGFMVLNATFNNISVIKWLVSFIGGGNRRTRRKSLTKTLSHNVVSSTSRHERDSNS
jgi:hypothetical protein